MLQDIPGIGGGYNVGKRSGYIHLTGTALDRALEVDTDISLQNRLLIESGELRYYEGGDIRKKSGAFVARNTPIKRVPSYSYEKTLRLHEKMDEYYKDGQIDNWDMAIDSLMEIIVEDPDPIMKLKGIEILCSLLVIEPDKLHTAMAIDTPLVVEVQDTSHNYVDGIIDKLQRYRDGVILSDTKEINIGEYIQVGEYVDMGNDMKISLTLHQRNDLMARRLNR